MSHTTQLESPVLIVDEGYNFLSGGFSTEELSMLAQMKQICDAAQPMKDVRDLRMYLLTHLIPGYSIYGGGSHLAIYRIDDRKGDPAMQERLAMITAHGNYYEDYVRKCNRGLDQFMNPQPQQPGHTLTYFEAWQQGIIPFKNPGHFTTLILQSYQVADMGNRARLIRAFPNYFTDLVA